MKHFLIVVDIQNDFVDGALGSDEAVGIIDAAAQKIKNFDGEIFVTYDTHFEDYLNTAEGKKLPVEHCIKGTAGWEICNELKPYVKKVVDKAKDIPSKAGEIASGIKAKATALFGKILKKA